MTILLFEKSGTVQGFRDKAQELDSDESIKAILVFTCDENRFNPENFNPVLQNLKTPVFGGIFPRIIFGDRSFVRGTVLVGLTEAVDLHMIPELSSEATEYDDILDQKVPDIGDTRTMLVFVDGFAKNISNLIESLFNIFGLGVNYIGGGAGSLSMTQKPCLLSNQGLLMDCALLCLMKKHSGVGVSHGWEKISGPYKVTESNRNTIISLDWAPAFDVYKKVVEEHSGQKFTDQNFFEIAKSYPFGISKWEEERVVRDPIKKNENGELVCVGEVPQDNFVDILTGEPKNLINAAINALKLGEKAFKPETDQKMAIFIDCISRVLFLGDRFKDEITSVHSQIGAATPMVGALTIGEIANSGADYLEFYNKTSVVGVLER